MLTKRIHLNILHNNQLIMILMKHSPINNISQILLIPFRKKHHRFRVSFRCTVQTFPIGILADAFEDRADGAGEFRESSFGFGGVRALEEAVFSSYAWPGEAVEVDGGGLSKR